MAWLTSPVLDSPYVVLAFAAPQSVSTETPLLALAQYGDLHKDLAFTLRNHDVTNRAAMYIEQSESGVVNDEDRETLYIGPGKERTFEFRDILRLQWGLAAAGDPDAGFPTVQVSFQLLGRRRQPSHRRF